MISWELLKESFTKNLPNTILIILVFATLNSKLNKLLINEGISNTKVERLEKDVNEVKEDNRIILIRLRSLERAFSGHIGDAYIRDEEDN